MPDLFDGRTFASIEEGIAFVQELGFDTMSARGEGAAADLEPGFVVVGLSMGVIPAQRIGVEDDGVAAVVAVGSCLPPEFLGAPWPRSVPLRILASEGDAMFAEEGDLEAALALVEAAKAGAGASGAGPAAGPANVKLRLLPGKEHLFMEADDADSRSATSELYELVLRFLQRADEALPLPSDPDDEAPGFEEL